jgi:hypothetical protein
MVHMRLVPGLVAVLLAVSCSGSTYSPPDRTDQVQATEGELASVVGAAFEGADCDVRFLGESEGSSFVWAECAGPLGEISAPMRVDGDDVQVPGDGSLYDDDVRRLFPDDLADAILAREGRLRP